MSVGGGVTVFLIVFAAFWVWLARRLGASDELTEKLGFMLMAQVSIAQEDLDGAAESFEALVDVIKSIDTTKLPPADQSKLLSALTDVTTAVNDKLAPTTPVTEPTDGDITDPVDDPDDTGE